MKVSADFSGNQMCLGVTGMQGEILQLNVADFIVKIEVVDL